MAKSTFFTYHDATLTPFQGSVVCEFPLKLIVNKREIATLISSPHDLRFLVAGFLRLQGFVLSLADFRMFSVCEEFGTANIEITGELPEKLKPVLTSGCGTGISFSMPEIPPRNCDNDVRKNQVKPAHIFSLMDELAKRAECYRAHGGIHSAAVGRDGIVLSYAEDLGRHNTLDRIAGEALFKGIDLSSTIMATSGRVSTEMVAKAALLGVRLIASRTSPTDMAVKLCEQSGICLIGYVRSGRFTVYCHPEQLDQFPDSDRIAGVSAAILAGGASSRMGTNKALLQVDGTPIITRTYQTLARLFNDVVVVTNSPEEYDFLPCRKIPDVFSGVGSIAGLHAAIADSASERIFVTACDMPFVDPTIIRHLCDLQLNGFDAVIPFSSGGQEPLHAVYMKKCQTVFEEAIRGNERKILDILEKMNTRLVAWGELQSVSGSDRSFLNVNTPEEYSSIQEGNACGCVAPQKKS